MRVGIPRLVAPLLANMLWRIPTDERVLYLTYDDGPSDDHTGALSELLRSRGCQATFFMTGRQMEKHPVIARRIREEGHSVGLHGYFHLDAWRCRANNVISDLKRGLEVFRSVHPDHQVLYRPPYGRFRPILNRMIRDEGGMTVMWDILADDYEPEADADAVAQHVCDHARPGSIVVLHDGPDSGRHSLRVTEAILERMIQNDWRFHPLLPLRSVL